MKLSSFILLAGLFLLPHAGFGQPAVRVVPTVTTNHYDESEPDSYGVIHVMTAEQKIRAEVKGLARNATYDVVLLSETTGKRKKIGTLTTDRSGFSSTVFDASDLLDTYNAFLLMKDEDVIQYAQLHEGTHGCICKHSGATIVTRNLDQICYECPCGVKFEICCGGKR